MTERRSYEDLELELIEAKADLVENLGIIHNYVDLKYKLQKELVESKKETKKYRQWHEHASKSVRYYREKELPDAQQQVKTLRETLENLRQYAGHEKGADLPMGQSIPECTFWSNFRMCSCGYAKQAIREGQEARDRGDVRSLEDVKRELALQQPATETVCPCNVVFDVMNDKFCTPCWEACYGRRRDINCATPGCVDGKIQVEESTDGN